MIFCRPKPPEHKPTATVKTAEATASYQQAEVSTEGVTERDNLNRGREKCVIIPSNILLVSDGTSLRRE